MAVEEWCSAPGIKLTHLSEMLFILSLTLLRHKRCIRNCTEPVAICQIHKVNDIIIIDANRIIRFMPGAIIIIDPI